ncbi:ATP-binding cassette domain-containing protein [Aliivibrio kagoshimensis]|uniref:ATP-binding cassette domain-containing protein n=1 Tax=Aliivibrio kagoshimensis TaxID=2910230 RepID=UPI003D0AC0F1
MTLTVNNFSVINPSGVALFPPLSFSVEPGEVLSLMGPSGCGKSTLLSAIAGHLHKDFTLHGHCSLDNLPLDNLAVEERQIGMLFQDDMLFPHLNIWENLAIALPNRVKNPERKERALATLKAHNLAELANQEPTSISGGQRARVSLLRMLLAEPKAVLLDEPFSKLDASLRLDFKQWVFLQIKQRGLPALMVTHDISDVPDQCNCLDWPWEHGLECRNAG